MATQQATFIIVEGNDKDAAKNSFDIGRYSSPYQEGVKFTVTDWARVRLKQSNANGEELEDDGRRWPVLKTKIGDFESYIFISTIVANKPTADGEVIQTDGKVNNLVRKKIGEFIAAKKSDAETLQALFDMLKDKVIVVRRKPYVALTQRTETREPQRYATSLVNLNFERK